MESVENSAEAHPVDFFQRCKGKLAHLFTDDGGTMIWFQMEHRRDCTNKSNQTVTVMRLEKKKRK